MTPRQARALLALIADLYLLCQTPEPEPESAPVHNNHQEPAKKKEVV